MSHNDNNPQRSARRHVPALTAIAVVLLAAVVIFLVFRPGTNEENSGIATTPPPEGTPLGAFYAITIGGTIISVAVGFWLYRHAQSLKKA